MSGKYAWFFLFLAVAYTFYSNNYHNKILNTYVNKHLYKVYQSFFKEKDIISSKGDILFTREKLKEFKSVESGLYIAILGDVFDVSNGVEYYAPGATYNGFTGCDASQAFITGDFTEKGLTDDISELTPAEIKSLVKWADFYNNTYIYKGKLIGRFYDEHGDPTEELSQVKEKLKIAIKNEKNEEALQRKFPPCNVEWKEETGTRVWCSTRSGGIARDWSGVPRMFFEKPGSKHHRCACVNLGGAVYKANKGRIREYENCDKEQLNCYIKVEDLS